ncbi:MAG TPA: ATP-binding protein, partial [Alphaproteobacteria bacterium]|nr:ATP-binding protein [Alphaproteobacteria bacterium]
MIAIPLMRKRSPLSRLKRFLPRSLFGRTLLIIVVMTGIALLIATYVFFDRHWYTVTNRMTYAVAGDAAVAIDLVRHAPTPAARDAFRRLIFDKTDLKITFMPHAKLKRRPYDHLDPLRDMLDIALRDRLHYPFDVNMHPKEPESVAIRVGAPDGVYRVLSPLRRIYTPTTQVFIGWMTGSSILLAAVALLFMRNQIRPIRRLAEAAEAIGKGRSVPWFKPEGAMEVRQAGAALMVMRDRLRRQISQRTAMLAGVSHDLRTPLTRMKLQLALMPETPETAEFVADIAEMENMLEAYLAFARGEESEPAAAADLAQLLSEVVTAARRQNPHILLYAPSGANVTLRRNAMKRCLANLIGNAARYGQQAQIVASVDNQTAQITIDDDGPGIAPERREDVFRPFMRLDESRNPATGGVGLGLAIARDIARFHGGDVVLEDSPLGGL